METHAQSMTLAVTPSAKQVPSATVMMGMNVLRTFVQQAACAPTAESSGFATMATAVRKETNVTTVSAPHWPYFRAMTTTHAPQTAATQSTDASRNTTPCPAAMEVSAPHMTHV